MVHAICTSNHLCRLRMHLNFCRYAVPNIAALVVAVYSGYYILLDPVAGLSWAICCGVPMWLGSTAVVATVGDIKREEDLPDAAGQATMRHQC
jgi:hypothetical protein